MHFKSLLGLVAVAQASPHLLGLDADVSLGKGLGVNAGVDVGHAVNADVGAKVGGAAGVDADVSAGVGHGVNADVNAKVGDGIKADVGAKVGDGIKADVNAEVGDGVKAGVKADVGGAAGVDADVKLGLGSNNKVSKTQGAATCPLSHSWEDRTLFKGVAAPASANGAAIKLGLNLPKAQIEGDATLELVKNFLQEPRVRIGLGGVKAYVEVDISASAAVHESIELFASPALELEIPGLLEAEAGAAVALDLVVGVDAAIDLSAGVYLAFGPEAFVEVSLLTKDIVDVSLEGLVTKALPLGVGAEVDLSADINLQLGLRLRAEVDLEAELDIPVLEIEAGAKVAVWVSLFEYTAALIATDNCAVSVDEVIALTLGLAVDLDVEVGDILDLSLAPTLTVELATAAKAKVCMPNRGQTGAFLELEGKDGDKSDKSETRTISLATAGAGSDATDAYDLPVATGTNGSPLYGSAAKPVTTAAPSVHGNGTIGDVTRTLTSTQVYTVTSCAASVINCPARYTQKVVTSTIIKSTYVCPATETGVPAMTTATHAAPKPCTTITDTLTTVVPCKTRKTKTFQPPTTAPPAPTVTIVESTTYCPENPKTTGVASGTTEVPQKPTHEVPTPEKPTKPTYDTPEKPTHEVPTPGKPTKPTYETPEKPTHEVPTPQKPTGDKPVLPPAATVPYPPPGNGTVPTPPPVAPSSWVVPPPVYETPVAQPPHSAVPPPPQAPPAVPTQPVYPPPAAGTPPPTVPTPPVAVSGGSIVRSGLLMAVPAVIAVFM
ncbi:uncharacterized protein B0J16DRAFT_349265 [Fusarium flagelliforme]|uniref:uncharacterized protein n=1 Tax=Fusarium flagelliforme TaxID=2675880 RepID=UPI001E8D08E9|nr:uncharacterized protein B0J16DRAFT_349265 [Fusarium flagelliforme]KAH7174841.1 hypothetical protein B0J16DRAFT_349265 [Fusarium flagelliforme]